MQTDGLGGKRGRRNEASSLPIVRYDFSLEPFSSLLLKSIKALLCIFANKIYLRDNSVHIHLTVDRIPDQKLMPTILVEKYTYILMFLKSTGDPSSTEMTQVVQTEN